MLPTVTEKEIEIKLLLEKQIQLFNYLLCVKFNFAIKIITEIMHISRYGDKNKTRFYKKSCDSYPAALLVMTHV